MADMSAIAAALSSFNTLKNIAQAMVTLRDANALQTKVIEFNGALIDAQTQIFAVNQERTSLIDQIGQLEKEVANLKAWEREKERYQLQQVPPGSFVYRLKQGMEAGEPPHSICERCYQQGKKSILHQSATNSGLYHLKCNGCGTDMRVGHYNPPPPISRSGTPWGA